MDVLIKNIDYTFEEYKFLDGDNPPPFAIQAHITYLITGKGEELEGEMDIEFGEYMEMKHGDIIQFIKSNSSVINFE